MIGNQKIDEQVDSSVMTSFFYEPKEHILGIRFQSGSVYIYDGVGKGAVEQLEEAGSKGSFFNEAIKGNYSFDRIS